MKINKIQETEIWQEYNTWLKAYLNADVKTYEAFLDDDYRFIGSTNNEEFLNRNDTTSFFERTGEQLAGITDLRNETRTLEAFGTSIFLTHLFDLWFLNNGDWTYYGRFRCTSIMQKKKEGWRFIYQHFSMPDSKSDEGETIGYDKVNAENIELKEAIKRRTIELESKNREMEVEAALERVRSASMAMHITSELQTVISAVFGQLKELNLPLDACYIDIFEPDNWGLNIWVGTETDTYPEKLTVSYLDHPLFNKMKHARLQHESFFTLKGDKESKNRFVSHLVSENDVAQERLDFMLQLDGLDMSVAISEHAALSVYNYRGKTYSEAENEIIKRFSIVFQQAYTRFLDIQKAEAQAREAQIEASLERIRAKAMAMHHSDELDEVLSVLCAQFDLLGINPMSTHITLLDIEHNKFTFRETGKFGDRSFGEQTVALDAMDTWKDMVESWKSAEPYSINRLHFPKETLAQVWEVFHESFASMPEGSKITPDDYPDGIYHTAGKHPFGYIGMNQVRPATEKEEQIVIKFANEFGRAYQRFLDLQKAEAQAREAQIEAALERLRSRTMAMHSSQDVDMIVTTLFDELLKLGVDKWIRSGIGILDKSRRMEVWTASTNPSGQTALDKGFLDMETHQLLKEIQEAWETKKTINSYELVGDDLINYFKTINGAPEYSFQVDFEKLPNKIIHYDFFFPEGALFAFSPTPLSDEISRVFMRFASVFGQTYRRYLDLQKAEAQAREAEIQLALERVRARTMAMHKSEELGDVAAVLFEQISTLTFIPERVNIAIADKENESFDTWVIDQKSQKISKRFIFKVVHSSVVQEVFNAWEKESYLVQHLHGKRLKEWVRQMQEQIGLPFNEENLSEHRYINSFFFSQGCMGITTNEPLGDEVVELILRFANVFEQTYTRFLDLQKAEAQTREAQIEAALERVRARTMAMQSSNELRDVALELRKQMGILEISELETCAIHLYEGSEDYFTSWAASKSINNESGYILSEIHFPRIGVSSLEEIIDLYRKKTMDYVVTNDHKRLSEFMEVLKDVTPETYKIVLETFESVPENKIKTFWACADFNGGSLVISTTTMPSNDTRELLRRFANVFNLSYQRFSDLKQAEAQAREAKIELALERVRARTMAMHKSDELAEVVAILYEQIQNLGFTDWGCSIIICDQEAQVMRYWYSEKNLAHLPDYCNVSLANKRVKKIWKLWQSGIPQFDISLLVKAKEDFTSFMLNDTDYHDILPEDVKEGWIKPKDIFLSYFTFKYGMLEFLDIKPLEKTNYPTYQRLAKVFEQTYTRFLDLQKAEAQSREAQIEAALERIRSRAMAMQHSEELRDVALELRTQMGILGQKDLEVCAIHLYEEHKDHFESWAAMHLPGKEEGLLQFQALFPKSGKLIIDEMMECYASDQNEYVLVNEGEKGRQWFELLREKAPEAFQYLMEATANIPAEQMKAYWGIADFSGGALVMVTYFYPDKDSRDLLRRTANVFALAYKRFKDLRMAESSARAARRQASLDRIRVDISSMRNAEDLNRITPLVFNELTALGIPFIRCGVFIVHEKEENVEIYLSTPEGKSLAVMTLPFSANEMTSKSVEAWKKEEVYIQHWNQTDFTNWGKSMQEQGYVKDLKTYQGTETAPESLHLHFVPFGQGLLYVGSPENLSEEQIDLVKAMAKAFSIAYARFEDFVKLEQAKAEVESAMSELKATQSQLVQQEKLASLGQLTAGIAHEIKNPLNFVNNFSEVSMEMIEEVLEARSERREAREKNQDTRIKNQEKDESEEMEDEILEDIKANLGKIHEHGTRANGIVTSMLQHSRGGSGKKEPTDLNALIKEYVNLSYHGMRAGKNPINVDIVLDLDPKLGEVSLIKEDFTRVVINLCNNSFDAMKEKVKMYQVQSTKYQEGVYSEVKYLPKLKVTTMLEKGQVRIAFEDNGPGIPDEIKDKILQPFFTTKKGTEGTGLGLSITHDIIKAHGGQINIESNENEGSKFSILLDV